MPTPPITIVVSGPPGSGKSSRVIPAIQRALEREGYSVLTGELENIRRGAIEVAQPDIVVLETQFSAIKAKAR